MANLVTSFRDFVDREQLFSKTDKLLLACSGGLDSTVLAHLLHAEGYDFAIAHMNFQLRGEASDGDAAFVKELARTLGAKFFIKAVDVKEEALAGESTQMTARRLRYNYFEKILNEYNFDRILTAHHLDDNFETVMMNFIRSTGITGMRGIDPRFGYLARPLLSCSRQTIQQYANTNSISWREDISNKSDDYLRNRIRHHLMPVFRDTFGMSDKTIAGNILNLRGGEAFYSMGLEVERKRRVKTEGKTVIISRESAGEFVKERTFLHRYLVPFFGFTTNQVDQLCNLPDNRFLDSEKYRISVMPNEWVITPLAIITPLAAQAIVKLPVIISEGHHNLHLSLEPRPPDLGSKRFQLLAPPTLPLHLRPRKNGDRFQPLGMGGKTKKVKDYMIDQKIPVWLRDRIYLLCNAEDEIMAIPGYCVSEKFKVLPEHETVLRIAWN